MKSKSWLPNLVSKQNTLQEGEEGNDAGVEEKKTSLINEAGKTLLTNKKALEIPSQAVSIKKE